MKFCKECKINFPDENVFCPKCGTKLEINDNSEEKKDNFENTIVQENDKLGDKKTSNIWTKFRVLIIVGILFVITIVSLILYFSLTVRIPNVIGVDEETAKQSILNANLIPAIEKGYADNKKYDEDNKYIGKISRNYVEVGKVIEMSPNPLRRTLKNNRVTLTISQGPKYYRITNGVINWKDNQIHVESYSTNDVVDGIIEAIIEVKSPSGKNIKWANSGSATTAASDKTIGVTISKVTKPALTLSITEWYKAEESDDFEIKDRIANANETVDLYVEIPVKDFGVLTPEIINMKLQCDVNEKYSEIEFVFNNTYGFDD